MLPLWFYFVFLPLVGALVGWATNALAVEMLFRPGKPVKLPGGYELQGLIPKRQEEIASAIAETVERDLLNTEDFRAFLQDPEMLETLKPLIRKEAEEYLKEKKDKAPAFLRQLFSSSAENRLLDWVVRRVCKVLPKAAEHVADEAGKRIDVRSLVRERIASFEVSTMEDITNRIAARELGAIKAIGGIVGAIAGIIQAAIISIL